MPPYHNGQVADLARLTGPATMQRWYCQQPTLAHLPKSESSTGKFAIQYAPAHFHQLLLRVDEPHLSSIAVLYAVLVVRVCWLRRLEPSIGLEWLYGRSVLARLSYSARCLPDRRTVTQVPKRKANTLDQSSSVVASQFALLPSWKFVCRKCPFSTSSIEKWDWLVLKEYQAIVLLNSSLLRS